MEIHDGSRNIIATPATGSSSTEFALPDSSWDDARLLDYMRRHDEAIGGLERKTIQHEYCFGAAAQMKYEQMGGKWTQWAKDQGYPLETFRRRRLLYVRAGSLKALGNYDGKMEAYYELGIYRRPSPKDLDALDAEIQAKATSGNVEAVSPAPEQPEDAGTTPIQGQVIPAPPGDDEAEETLEGLTAPMGLTDAPTAAEILGKVGSLLLEAERLGLDDPCPALLDDIATILGRLRNGLGGKGVAA